LMDNKLREAVHSPYRLAWLDWRWCRSSPRCYSCMAFRGTSWQSSAHSDSGKSDRKTCCRDVWY
jgi:hypothetical protein